MSKPRIHLIKSRPLQISYCQKYDVAWDQLTDKSRETTCRNCLKQVGKMRELLSRFKTPSLFAVPAAVSQTSDSTESSTPAPTQPGTTMPTRKTNRKAGSGTAGAKATGKKG